ncbi:26302_t:CDS:1 [Dentiscutata erythropus]|uniref:26302_t:CDS:1 n=1 Tax=Dentiscutata erythropus TaxID=1348616 RepID=A0A9N9JWE6_9GLOM|nr:26302_t:CDS:1 [Dentiscutata erythropus]
MQFNCEVAAKVLQLNLAAESRYLYLNTPHTNRTIKNLLIYKRIDNGEDSYDTVHLHKQIAITLDLYLKLDYVVFFKVYTDIDQRIFERLRNLKNILLKNCTITKKRFLEYEKYVKSHRNLSFTIHECVIRNHSELNFNRTFRIIRDTLSSHDYLVYGWNNLTNDEIINNHKNLSSILHRI